MIVKGRLVRAAYLVSLLVGTVAWLWGLAAGIAWAAGLV